MLSILRYTLKNTLIYSIGTFSSRLASFILIPLYTSHFSTAEYGMMSIMEITLQVLTILIGLSLSTAFFRWYWDKKYVDNQKSILFTILVFTFFQFLLIAFLILSFQKELSFLLFESYDHSYLVKLLIVTGILESIGLNISILLRLKEQAAYYTLLQIIKLVVSVFLTVYFITHHNRGIEAIYEASVIANTLYLILLFNVLRQNIEFKFELKILRDMLVFSIPLMLTSFSGLILNITDRYSLRFIADISDVGIYSLGFKVANTIKVFIITSVNLALQPVIFKMMDQPGNKRFYSKVMTYFTFGLMFFVLFFSLYSPEIIKIISKNNMQYWAAYQIVPVLSFSMLFSMLKDVSFTGLHVTKKTRIIAVLITGVAIINILLNLLLIPKFGFYGAAIATTVSQVIYFMLVYFFAQKYYSIPFEITKVIIMILLGAGLYFAGSFTNDWPLTWRLIIKATIIVSFPLILYLFGFYEPVEIERIGQFWRKWKNPFGWLKNIRGTY